MVVIVEGETGRHRRADNQCEYIGGGLRKYVLCWTGWPTKVINVRGGGRGLSFFDINWVNTG